MAAFFERINDSGCLMKESLADQAYNTIRKDILTCVLDPGSQIAQSQLVERYEYGVTPIRDALKRLEHEGFVRSIPRFGYIISPITPKDVEDLFELRLALEVLAVRKAIERASDEQLIQLRELSDTTYIYQDRVTYLHFLEHNLSFHYAIALASGNRKLADVLAETLHEMTRIFNLGLDLHDRSDQIQHEHVALADAIYARDTGQAIEIVTEQLISWRKRTLEDLRTRLDQKAITEITLS